MKERPGRKNLEWRKVKKKALEGIKLGDKNRNNEIQKEELL